MLEETLDAAGIYPLTVLIKFDRVNLSDISEDEKAWCLEHLDELKHEQEKHDTTG